MHAFMGVIEPLSAPPTSSATWLSLRSLRDDMFPLVVVKINNF